MYQVVIGFFTVELSLFILSSISIGVWKAPSCDHIIVGIGSCVIVIYKNKLCSFYQKMLC